MKFICEQCKGEYNRPFRSNRLYRFCSKRCYGNWKIGKEMSLHIRQKIGIANKGKNWNGREFICENCKISFIKSPSKRPLENSFCSRKCYFEWKYPEEKQLKVCKQCKREFKPYNAELKKGGGKFCSKECYLQWNRGKNSSNWKGGITSERAKLYHSPEYYNWRRTVFIRDEFTCQVCKVKSINIQAHHIKPWRKYPELIYEIENGMTVCKSCHCVIEPRRIKLEV